jgi:hypothetical protein
VFLLLKVCEFCRNEDFEIFGEGIGIMIIMFGLIVLLVYFL